MEPGEQFTAPAVTSIDSKDDLGGELGTKQIVGFSRRVFRVVNDGGGSSWFPVPLSRPGQHLRH
jgi:hypothetical protein